MGSGGVSGVFGGGVQSLSQYQSHMLYLLCYSSRETPLKLDIYVIEP